MSAQEAQVLTVPSAPTPAPLYPFLAQPPPQKKRPTQPLPAPPTRPPLGKRRSATFSHISAWAAEVHPGSPAPFSPKRVPSGCGPRRSSYASARRPSGSSIRVPSASFINFAETPTAASRLQITPSVKDFKPDLAALGYTSVFIHFPETPMTPEALSHAPSSPVRPATQGGLKRFRSLTSLKSPRRARSRVPPSPPYSPGKASLEAKRARAAATAAVSRSKKSKYPQLRPAPLQNELALAQMMDGGKIDDHVRQFNRAEAKAAGAVKVNGQLVGVGDVWRDEQGGIWRDQEEEWEFTHLLGGDDDVCMGEVQWVDFSSEANRVSLSTKDSDLSPRYAMNVETDAYDDLAAFGDAAMPTSPCKPGMSVLAIPARSRRTAKHLRKPEYLLDVFPIPRSPVKSVGPRSPLSPRFATFHIAPRPKGKARRRPAPLNLTLITPGPQGATNPADADQGRDEFLQDSFAPRPRLHTRPSHSRQAMIFHPTNTTPASPQKLATKSSIMNMKGFFKTMGTKKALTV